jgi:hypothetical protein
MHRNQQFSVFDEGRDLDARWRIRELCRVGDNLTKRLLDQNGIDVHQRQIAAEAQLHAAVGIAAAHAFDRGIDNVGRIGPVATRMQPLARDQRRIQQVLNVAVQPHGFVPDPAGQRRQARILGDSRHLGHDRHPA